MMASRALIARSLSGVVPILALCQAQCGTRVISAIDLGPTSESGSSSSASALPDGGLDAATLDLDAPAPRTDLVWPNQTSSANSAAWLVDHHDDITEMRPNVLALDFFNRASAAQARQKAQQMIDAIAEGSRYHGYSDPTAPPFLEYHLAGFIDLTDSMPPSNWPYVSSTRLPVTASGKFDMSALFSSSFASNYDFPDPNNPTRYLTLCELFERGIINELWLLVGSDMSGRKPPLMVESKQEYDAQNRPLPGMFNSCTGYDCLPADMPHCSVTARIAHLDPTQPGPGCDLLVRSIGIENMRVALQYLQDNASDFFNDDFKSRFRTDFDSWTELVEMGGVGSWWCTQNGPACISYPSQTTAIGTYPDGGTWKIDPFIQGCGNAHFPPNAQFLWDYSNPQPVQSRCENYGLHNGPDGGDRTDVYTSAKVTASTLSSGDYCPNGWQNYLRQSMPGLGNKARAVDGSPMKNWWPFLFY
jgi:hypothetical protein